MLQTLRSRLILSHSLPLLIVVPLMGIALIYAMETRVLLARSTDQLLGNASLVVELAARQPEVWQDAGLAQEFAGEMGQHLGNRVMLLDNQGKLLASSDAGDAGRLGQDLGLEAVAAALRGETSTLTRYSRNLDAEVADVLVPARATGGQVVGVVRLTHRLGNIYEDLMRMQGVVAGILAVGLVLGIFVALLLANSLLRPVTRFSEEMQEMAASRELMPVPEGGIQEMQSLVQTFNLLVERLNAQDTERRSLLANLVHELGRPLGALKSASDALLGGAAEDEALRDEMLAGMADEIVLLRRLLDDLARLYDKESGQIKLIREPVNLNTWLPQLLLSWQADALKKDLHWQSDIASDLPILEIDPGRMAQAVGNLLNNAIKYTPAGGSVMVSAGTEAGQVYIRIQDTGEGITAEAQAQVFTPFYRGQWNRRFPQGLGLGLSIARDLVLAHGGTLDLASEVGQGSTFTIWLPFSTDGI